MPNITVNGTVYPIPNQGTSPPWGTDLTDAIVAIANSLNSVTGPQDIPTTTFNLTNNQASPSPITGAVFDTSSVRSAIVSYNIYRSNGSVETSEVGTIYLTYSSLTPGWVISQVYAGTSGIVFSITTAGQLRYTSTDITGSTGKITFSAKAFLQ